MAWARRGWPTCCRPARWAPAWASTKGWRARAPSSPACGPGWRGAQTARLPARARGPGLGLYQGLGGGCALIAGVWAGLAGGQDGHVPMLISGAIVAMLAPVLALGGARLSR